MMRRSQNTAEIMISVPDVCYFCVCCVCAYGMCIHVDLTLLNMEIILDTQILKKFRVELILVAFKQVALQAFFRGFWTKYENP